MCDLGEAELRVYGSKNAAETRRSLAAASWSPSSLLAADFTVYDCTTCLTKAEYLIIHLEYNI